MGKMCRRIDAFGEARDGSCDSFRSVRNVVVQNETQAGAEAFDLRPGHSVFGLVDNRFFAQEGVHLSAACENVRIVSDRCSRDVFDNVSWFCVRGISSICQGF